MRSSDSTQPRAPEPIQYELRIGVTGHRKLANRDAVRPRVDELLQHVVTVLEGAAARPFGTHGSERSGWDKLDRVLAQSLGYGTRFFGWPLDLITTLIAAPVRGFPSLARWPRVPISTARPDSGLQTPLKLTVISSLAKGADQIVARAVCDLVQNPTERNRYVEAVLPFPQKLYEEDFADAEDRDALRALLKLDCGRLNTNPKPTVLFADFPRAGDSADPDRRVSREDAYAAAGRYVVNTCEILVAVWDPTRTAKPGGTAAAVRYALERGRVVLWINPARLSDGSFLLVTPQAHRRPSRRRSKTGKVNEAVQPLLPEWVQAAPLPTRARHLSQNFHRLAAYNRDGAADQSTLLNDVRERSQELDALAHACRLPSKPTRALADTLLPHVMRADHLGRRYRDLRDFSARLWPTTAAVLVSLMAFQLIFLPALYKVAWVELFLLTMGVISYRVSVYDGWHDKWLNDRRLAEALRGAMFVTLVRSDEEAARARALSIGGAFGRVQDPLPFYSPANSWFVATMKRVLAKERRQFASTLDLDDRAQRLSVAKFLKEAWIGAQADYHRDHAQRRKRIAVRARRFRGLMILGLAAVAIAHGWGFGHGAHDAASWLAKFDHVIGLATVALPAWAAAFHVMWSLDDHERMAERSTLMASLLDGLARQLDEVENVSQLRECVTEAERILDLESAEWAESLIDRKPEFTG